MICVYFSGTGNTKYCAEKLLKKLNENNLSYSIEEDGVAEAIQSSEEILFSYPVYYSAMPKIVFDFIEKHSALWKGKRIFILCTMGLFSGDGAGVGARLFKKYGAKISGGLHVKMPDCIGDVKLLKKSETNKRKLVVAADRKIERAVCRIRKNRYPHNGLGFFYHMAGLFGQRLYFRGKTKRYYDKVKCDWEKCVACGKCVSLCPMKNIEIKNGGVSFCGKCTMCYRCFANCPQKAITLLGKTVYEQYKFDNLS